MFSHPTLYAQYNPDGSVTLYKDQQKAKVYVTIEKHNSARPTRRNKSITLNCFNWRLQWLPYEVAW